MLLAVACALSWGGWRRRLERPLQLVGGVGAWLAALALVSTVWSPQQHLTFGRAASFALLFLTVGLLALASRTRPRLPAALALGLLAATLAAAVIGVLMLAFAHSDAVQPASYQYGARFRGLGMNPDTLPMLDGLALPVALWSLVRAREGALRLLGLASAVLFVVEIGASGSRGGLLALLVGGIVTAAALPRRPRERLAIALAVVVSTVAAAGGTTIAKPLPPTAGGGSQTTSSGGPASSPGSNLGAPEQQYTGRLTDELYRVDTGTRSLFSSSGREQAVWLGIHQGDARPALGYGFGMEDKVFIDRVYNFQGEYVEDTFVGLYLELGLVGVLSLLTLLALVVLYCVRIVRAGRTVAPALVGIVAAGIALMFAQSYAYSVGNVATVAFWVAAFLVAGVAALHGDESDAPS